VHRPAAEQGKAISAADALDGNPVDVRRFCRTAPSRADHPDPMTPSRQASEDLEQVHFRPACMGVRAVLPVDEKDVHDAEVGCNRPVVLRSYSLPIE
jgi:hypothetical protein